MSKHDMMRVIKSDEWGARVLPPHPWVFFEVEIFRKGIEYLNHCQFSPYFPDSVFGPKGRKINH